MHVSFYSNKMISSLSSDSISPFSLNKLYTLSCNAVNKFKPHDKKTKHLKTKPHDGLVRLSHSGRLKM